MPSGSDTTAGAGPKTDIEVDAATLGGQTPVSMDAAGGATQRPVDPPAADAATPTPPGPPPADAAAARDGAPSALFNPTACGAATGVLFCDDFESGLNPVYRVRNLAGGTITVDQTRPRGGKSSVHVKSLVKAYSDGEMNLGKPVFPTANNSFFMRAYVYYAPPAASDNVYLFRVDGVLPNTTTRVNIQIGNEGFPYGQPSAPNFKQLSTTIYHSDIKSADHVSYRTAAAPEVTFGRWACWEWEVDGVKNLWRTWVDGVEHFTRTWDGVAGTAWVVPSASAFTLGLHHDHDEGPNGIEVWFDDLVIADKRVGCLPP